MKKTLIILGSIILVLILLIVGAINFYFTNERLQRMVTPQIEAAVGRPVNVGSMSVSVFSTLPDAALNVRDFSIPGTENDTLLSIREASIRVEILPLWYDRVNIEQLDFDRPQFTYHVFRDGSTNIDFLFEAADDTAASEGQQPQAPADQPSTADTTQTRIQIPALTLRNARFGYVDQSSDTEFLLGKLNADLSMDYAREIITNLSLEVGHLLAKAGEQTYIDGLSVKLSQKSILNMEQETLTLQEGAFSIRALSLSLSGNLSNWSADDGPHADLQFTSSSDNFAELLKLAPASYQEELSKLETRGSLTLGGSIKGPLAGEELPGYNVSVKVDNGYLKNPDLKDPITNIQLIAQADNKNIQLKTLSAETGPNALSATGTIKDAMDPGQSTIDLTTDLKLDLSTIKNFYPIDPDTLSLGGNLTANARLVGKLDNIQQAVEEGNVTLQNGRVDYPAVIGPPLTDLNLDIQLSGNRLNLNRFTANSKGNTLQASGTVVNYLAEEPTFDVRTNGAYDLSQTHHYYQLKPYISELSGLVNLDVAANGAGFDPMDWDLNGSLNLTNVNAKGDSLPDPLQNLNGKLETTPTTMNVKSLAFKLGESDFDVQGKFTHYKEFLEPGEDGPTPKLTGSYRSKTLNVDQFIDWDEEADPETVYPIDLPHMNSTITTRIDKLIVMGIAFTDVKGQAGTTPEKITVNKASARMLEGTIKGDMTWTVRKPLQTHLDFDGTVDKVQADAFFREFRMIGGDNELHKYVEGAFSTDVSYAADINKHLMPVLKTTVSSGSFGMTKARLKGHPLQEKVAGFLKVPELTNMAMDEWKATYTIKDKVLTMKDLRLTSGNIGAEMEGTQHLENGNIDYQLKLYLPGRFKDKIASVITQKATEALTRENGTVMVPLRVKGTAEQPKVQPDREVIEPIVKDYLKDKAGDVIKNLFK